MDDNTTEEPPRRRALDHLRDVWHHVRKANHKHVARVAVVAHVSYYSLVFVEAHGLYGIAGGVCGLILIVEVILGAHGDE